MIYKPQNKTKKTASKTVHFKPELTVQFAPELTVHFKLELGVQFGAEYPVLQYE